MAIHRSSTPKAYTYENIQVGDSVIVGIRPDHISIDAPVGEQSVVAKIDRSMFLGGMVEYELSTASVPIRVRTMSTRIFQPGDDVTLSWSPLHVSIFLDDGKSALPTSAIGTSLS